MSPNFQLKLKSCVIMKYILIILVLVSVNNVEPKPQYYDSRGIWGIAVDQTLRNTNLQIYTGCPKKNALLAHL